VQPPFRLNQAIGQAQNPFFSQRVIVAYLHSAIALSIWLGGWLIRNPAIVIVELSLQQPLSLALLGELIELQQ
jgi:hypothetical protein